MLQPLDSFNIENVIMRLFMAHAHQNAFVHKICKDISLNFKNVNLGCCSTSMYRSKCVKKELTKKREFRIFERVWLPSSSSFLKVSTTKLIYFTSWQKKKIITTTLLPHMFLTGWSLHQ